MGLSEEERSSLIENYLEGVNYRKGSYHKDKSNKLLIIIVDENTKPELLKNIISGSSNKAVHDFFVSVSSDEQTAVVNIPDFVLALHEKVGGNVCFSYTCTFE